MSNSEVAGIFNPDSRISVKHLIVALAPAERDPHVDFPTLYKRLHFLSGLVNMDVPWRLQPLTLNFLGSPSPGP